MSATMSTPMALESPRGVLLGAKGWAGVMAAAVTLLVLVPVLNLMVPQGTLFHLSDYYVSLLGKILCYAICALAMDLIWGYTGILSLGHGLFFALGGYAMGMYLMRQIGRDGQYRMTMPDFMVFLNWKEFPWHWAFSDSFVFQMLMVVLVPGLLAFVFGFFAFRSRIKGVYFSIITQALTFAAMLLFFRNETGFGGNNGFTDFKRILDVPIATSQMRVLLCCITGAVLIGFFLMARCHRQQQVRPRAAGHPRRREPRDVHRLRPGGLQAEHLDAVGGDVRRGRRAVRAAGGHHQPRRDERRRRRSRSRSGPRSAAAPR
jgi:urea transport system permease protein